MIFYYNMLLDNFQTLIFDRHMNATGLNRINIKLLIQVDALQERDKSIASSFCKGAHFIFVFNDITLRKQFKKVAEKMRSVKKLLDKNFQGINESRNKSH